MTHDTGRNIAYILVKLADNYLAQSIFNILLVVLL